MSSSMETVCAFNTVSCNACFSTKTSATLLIIPNLGDHFCSLPQIPHRGSASILDFPLPYQSYESSRYNSFYLMNCYEDLVQHDPFCLNFSRQYPDCSQTLLSYSCVICTKEGEAPISGHLPTPPVYVMACQNQWCQF
jgi:hypothetical protein